MTSLSLILCEGAHDRGFLIGLAAVCGGWQVFDGSRDELPEAFNANYPEPKLDSSGWPEFIPSPEYLRKDDRWVEVRPLGGIDKVLGKTGVRFVEARLRDPLDGLGVVVDANDSRIESRVDSFRDRYKKVLAFNSRRFPSKTLKPLFSPRATTAGSYSIASPFPPREATISRKS